MTVTVSNPNDSMDDLMAPAEACPLASDEVVLASSDATVVLSEPPLPTQRADDVTTARANDHGAGQAVLAPRLENAGAVAPGLSSDGSGPGSNGAPVTTAGSATSINGRRGRKQTGDRSGLAALPTDSTDLGSGRSTPDVRWLDAGSEDSDGDGHTMNGRLTDGAVPASDLGPGHRVFGAPTTTAGAEIGDGHISRDAPRASAVADLALLHASLGHYARQLADIQKVRISMGNRVDAMERDGLPEEWAAPARASMEELARIERSINAYLAKQAKRHFLAEWVLEQRGIGLPGFARLLGITGPLDRFATVSKLWKYLGLHTVDGFAPKRQKGVKLNYSPQGRVLCHQLGESIVKMGKGGEYRKVYDSKKAEYLERERTGPSGCPTGQVHKSKEGKLIACVKAGENGTETSAHIHAMARRFAVKRLIRRTWLAWRKYQREMEAA